MKAPAILAVVAGIGLIVFGMWAWHEKSEKAEVDSYLSERQQIVDQTPVTNASTTDGVAKDEQSYTMADVAAHADKSSCWTAIRGNVYDVTAWIPRHPGGPQRIIDMCGKDASERYEGKHGGDARPEKMLATFKIGVLVQ